MRKMQKLFLSSLAVSLLMAVCLAGSASGAQLITGDDFNDGDYSNNPSWTVVDEDPAHPWAVSGGRLVLPTGYSGSAPTIRLDYTAEENRKLEIHYDLNYPYPTPSDYQPMYISLVNTATGTGHNLWATSNMPYGGNSGFGYGPYDDTPTAAGAAGQHLNQGTSAVVVIFDPDAGTIKMLYGGVEVISFTTSLTKIDRIEFTQYGSSVPMTIDNVLIYYAGALRTVLSEEFVDPAVPALPAAWVVDSGTFDHWWYDDTSLPPSAPDYPGDVMQGLTDGTIHIDFPAYTYDGTAGTNNPNGYEWQVTFDYCNGRYNGNSYSQWQVQMGNDTLQDAMHLQANDQGDGYSGNKFAFYRGTSSASPVFGTGAEPSWTWSSQCVTAMRTVTFAWEASEGVNGTLYMTHSQTNDGTVLNSGSWAIPSDQPTFNNFSRLSFNTTLTVAGAKKWIFDNVQVQTYSAPTENAGSMVTLAEDDFENGDYASPNLWVPNDPSKWAVAAYSGNMALTATLPASVYDSIYLDFPAYSYNFSDPTTYDPDGPEWRVSWRYSLGPANAAENSRLECRMGTAANPDQYEIWSSDSCFFGAGMKFVWRIDGSDYTSWGPTSGQGGDDATGIYWYEMTMEWEASTNTLTVTHTDPITETTYSNSYLPGSLFVSFDRLTFGCTAGGGAKKWLFDDIKLEVVGITGQCQQLIDAGYGLDGDMNADCYVDLQDFAQFSENWMTDINP